MFLHSFSTPIGNMRAITSDSGLVLLAFCDEVVSSEDIQKYELEWNVKIQEKGNAIGVATENQLNEYFDRRRKVFELPLDFRGTDFQHSVWNALLKIPYGRTKTYSDQAKELGDIKAIRAVAHANGLNPIAVVVPCHRIVGSDGSLTGYAGGLHRKRWLLEHESSQRALNF